MKRLIALVVALFASISLAFAAVDINTATKEELQTLKGVGPKKAQDIIDYRTKNGPFKSVEDLEKVKGIGPGIIKQIRADVTVSGEAPKADSGKKGKSEEKSKKEDKKEKEDKKAGTDSKKEDKKSAAKSDAPSDKSKSDKK